MKTKLRIGKASENEIIIQNEECLNQQAEINYIKGYWILKNLNENNSISINGEKIKNSIRLNKYDKISICNKTIYWSNYLYEGENQELELKVFTSFNGRISRSNYRALSLLSFGMAISVFFLPGLLVSAWQYLNRRKFSGEEFDYIGKIQDIAPIVHTFGFFLIGIFILLISIKRIRDTGNPTWKLLIPIYNLKILYFHLSK